MKDPNRLEKYQRWMAVFGTNQGQSVLKELKRFCNYESSSLVMSNVDGKIDPYYTAAQEGKRQVILHIIGVLTEPPDIKEDDEGEDREDTAGY